VLRAASSAGNDEPPHTAAIEAKGVHITATKYYAILLCNVALLNERDH